MLMYQGLASVIVDGEPRLTGCEIRLDLNRSMLFVHLASDEAWFTSVIFEGDDLHVTVPEGSSLAVPAEPLDSIEVKHFTWSTPANRMHAGDITAVAGFVIHVKGGIPSLRRPVDFELPNWRLRLVELSPSDNAYSHVVNAVPMTSEVDAQSIERLRQQLHAIVGLLAPIVHGVR